VERNSQQAPAWRRPGIIRRSARAVTLAVSALAVTAGLVAGCSSSSGQNAADSATSSGVTSCLQKTKAVTAEALQAPTIQLPPASLDTAHLAGKTVWVITFTSEVPALKQEAEGLTEAGKTLGFAVKAFDGQGNPAQQSAGIEEAVSQHASAIVLIAVDPTTMVGPLSKAAAAHIPVVSVINQDASSPAPKYVTAQISQDAAKISKWEANYMLNATGCSGTYGYFWSPNFVADKWFEPAMVSTFKQQCPSCHLDLVSEPAGATQSAFSPIVNSFVQSHSGLKGIITDGVGTTDAITSALHATKTKVNIVGQAGDNTNVGYIMGGTEIGDVLWAPQEMIGYYIADEAARVATGQKPVREPFPVFLVTKDSVGNGRNVYAPFNGYQAKFGAFWKGTS
jgi:ribose transport system substrate-binding protein